MRLSPQQETIKRGAGVGVEDVLGVLLEELLEEEGLLEELLEAVGLLEELLEGEGMLLEELFEELFC